MRDKMLLLTSRALFVTYFLKAGIEVIPSNIEVSVLAIGKKQLQSLLDKKFSKFVSALQDAVS